MLIIKENIFFDVNTGSTLGGTASGTARGAQKTVKNRTFTLFLRACAPYGCIYFLPFLFVSELFSQSFGPDEASVCDGKNLQNKFYFFL
ncbi:hypothetical protein QUA41_26575 [Microcoleus sp. Pol11C1]|uniref:hypothetical protein n=1 Tax=unclassified Microcoleus TaxID=2642155 RepID=UPI002FD75D99